MEKEFDDLHKEFMKAIEEERASLRSEVNDYAKQMDAL